MLYSYTIRDARGVRRRVSPRLAEGLLGERDPRLRMLREYHRLRAARQSRIMLAVLFCLSAGVAGLGVAVYFMAQGYAREERLMMLALAVGGAILIPSWVRYNLWSRMGALEMRGIHDVPLCACCGTDYRGVQAEEDGCVVCPTCGAAWK